MLGYALLLFDCPVVAPMYYLPYYLRSSLCLIGLQQHWCIGGLRTRHDHDEDLSRRIINAMVCRIKQFRGLPWAQLLLFRFLLRPYMLLVLLHVTISVVCDPHVSPSALLIFIAL